MRSLVFGLGMAAMIGGAALAARTVGADSSIATLPESPCTPGPDYSAAVCRASEGDPDAPIANARYVSAPPLSQHETLVAASSSADRSGPAEPVKFASARVHTLRATTPLVLAEAETAAPGASGDLSGLSGLNNRLGLGNRTAASLSQMMAPLRRAARSQTLRQRLGEMADLGDRARVFVFAGAGDRLLGYNFTREAGRMKIGGWSMEQTLVRGDNQLGVAWNSGQVHLAMAGIQRKLSAFGTNVKDQMLALSFSISPPAKQPPPS
jgi:hypothetical protein